ncbi:hypothetical protein FS837_010952 [Tulasnella sp. UAMH 9824]|nr:hypothetical protein FS837_010952 [Tulasnella sp. UAMH 9824]
METSQAEHSQGDKSKEAISSVDSTAVNPTQGPPASGDEPTPNTGHPPTVRVDDSAAQDVVMPEDGGTSQGNQTTTSVDSEEKLTPNENEDSLLQPGVHVRERELPSELVGALTNIREPEGLVKKKKTNRTDGGAYADIYEGELERPDGGKTEVAIKRLRGLDKVEKLDRLCDAARGLSHLHSLSPVIVHGDIKPDNVLIKDNLEAVLCDFGISRIFLGIGKESGLTTTGNKVGGTAGYQAKELLEENTAPTTAGDLYAFGGLILAAMSGENPFYKKKNDTARIVSICHGQTPSPEDHPGLPETDPLWDLLQECWSESPEARPVIKTVLQKPGHPPTVRVDDSAVQGVVSSEEGASQESEAGSLDPNAREEDSLVQPGRHIPERDLPSELSGALTKIRELDGSVTKKTGDKTDGGTYADVFEGVLDQSDGSQIEVAIKSIRRFEGTEEKRFNTLCDAARGLVHLHSFDPVIIHGDIKPDNVLVMDNLDGALCDFGVSRLFVGIGKASGLTTTGNRTGGTAGYQAKELLEETAPSASAPGDVYAFGGLILAVCHFHPVSLGLI